jgi:hypothetical protein
VARKVTVDRKRIAEGISTKMGEVLMSRAALEAVVRFRPTDQHMRFRKVPRPARIPRYKKSRRETDHDFSCRKKKGNRAAVASIVLAAEKLRGEISRMAILAKG